MKSTAVEDSEHHLGNPLRSEDLDAEKDEDSDVNETAAEFFDEYGRFASFLDTMDLPSVGHRKYENQKKSENVQLKRNKSEEEDTSDVEDYERRPRSSEVPTVVETKKSRLPIKTKDGKIHRQTLRNDDKKEPLKVEHEHMLTSDGPEGGTSTMSVANEDTTKTSSTTSDEVDETDVSATHATYEDDENDSDSSVTDSPSSRTVLDEQANSVLRARYMRQLKRHVAELCTYALENPEDAVRSRDGKPSKLQALHRLGDSTDERAKRIVMLSQLRVFTDILPGYRIHEMTSSSSRQQLSKEVRRLRSTENAMLLAYRTYLRRLANSLNSSAPLLRATAVNCLGRLMLERPQFNHWRSVLASLVPVADEKDPPANDVAASFLANLLRDDESGHVSLEIARLVTKRLTSNVRTKKRRPIRVGLLATLRHAKVNSAVSKQKRKAMKKKRKRMRRDEIAIALAEAEAKERDTEIVARRASTLRELILIYFRILRSESRVDPGVVTEAMGGLRRVAHLLHFDVARELLQLLVVEVARRDGEGNSVDRTLECVLTAFRVAAGPGREMRFDLTPFSNALRRSLRWIWLPRYASNVPSAIFAVREAYLKRREEDGESVMTCARRLVESATYASDEGCVAMMSSCRELMQRYPSTLKGRLLGAPEEGVIGDDAGTAWTLSLLRKHFHPTVGTFAADFAKGNVMVRRSMDMKWDDWMSITV